MKIKTLLKIEKQIGENLVDYLYREYHQNFGRLVSISKNLGVSRKVLSNFMKHNKIQIRKSNETRWNNKKITPKKEELEKLYLVEKMNVKETGKKYGLSRTHIHYLIKKYGILTLNEEKILKNRWSRRYECCLECKTTKGFHSAHGLCKICYEHKRLGWQPIKRVKNIDEWEYQVILGSILGDAHLKKTYKSNRNKALSFFDEIHCLQQEKYLLWKKDYAFSKFNTKIEYYPNKNRIRLRTEVSPIFKKLRDELYPNNKKNITKDILNRLQPLGIAVWYMDDGTLNLHAGGCLATDGFTKEENEMIMNYFNEKGFYCRVFKAKSGTYRIMFNQQGFRNFIDFIKLHIHPSMYYKIDLNRQKEYYKLERLRKLERNMNIGRD